MTLIKKKITLFVLIAAGIFAAMNGCKKVDNTTGLTKADLEGIERAKKNVQAQMNALGGIPQRVEVNKKMQVAYADMTGNIVAKLPQTPNLVSTCAGDLPDYLDLSYYHKLYTCGEGYKIKFGWLVSWNNNVVLVNPRNSANITKGTIKISIPGNANAYTNTTTDVKITNMGTDPNSIANNIFFVEMTSTTSVPVNVVNAPDATLRLGGFFASDCVTLDNYYFIPMSVTGFGFVTPFNSDPCTRNDKAWFQMPGIEGIRQIGITGYDPLSICPSYPASAAPSYQRVQYSLDYGATWASFTNFSSTSSNIINSAYVSRTDFARSPTLAPGTYNIKIRYANTRLNAGVGGNTVPDSTNSCINGGWPAIAWTVESYPGVVVN